MNDESPKPRRRWFRRLLLGALAGFLLLVLSLVAYVHTDSFRSMVHARLVSVLEEMTGGQVDLGRFNVVPFRFRVEAHDLTIHGKERLNETPYAHVDNLIAYIKIISLFEREYGFQSLQLDHPVVHIIVYPDGSTNQPRPKVPDPQNQLQLQQLFSISINRLQVSHGEVIWNDYHMPLEVDAQKVSAELNYAFLRNRYDGSVRVGDVLTGWQGVQPFHSSVDTDFSLAANSIEIRSLRLVSGRSHLEASGRVEDFRKPILTGSYNGRIDGGMLALLLGTRELRAGMFEVGGKGTYSTSDFSLSGQLNAKDVEWKDKTLTLHNAAGSARYSLTPAKVNVSEIQARVFGGSATGNLDITNWLPSATSAQQTVRAKKEQSGSLVLGFKDISVPLLANTVSSKKLPLDKLKLAGSSAGSIEAKWRGAVRKNAEAKFVATTAPPAQVSPGQIPLTAHAEGTYLSLSDELFLNDLTVNTRATRLRASGKLSKSSNLKISAMTTNVAEWQPMLSSLGGPQIPIALRGRALFNGNANGKLSDFTIAGHVEMDDFDTLTGTKSQTPVPVHWDYLSADVKASPRMISARNGVLTRRPTAIDFEGTVVLADGSMTDFTPFTARAHVRNGDLEQLQALTGYNYPAAGKIDVTLNLSGTRVNPHGDGHLQLTNATIYGQVLPQLVSDLRLSEGEVQFNNFVVSYRDSRIIGGAAYSPSTRSFHFNLSGADFNLKRFSELQVSHVLVEGRMDFTAQGNGTLDEPVVNANVKFRDLVLDHEKAGDFTFDAVTRGPDLQLTGRSNFEQAELSIDGSVRLREQWPADLSLRFDRLDVDSVLRSYLKDRVTGHSSVAGTLQLRGPLRQPQLLSVTGDLNSLSANIENAVVQNDGPIRFSIDNQVLSLTQLKLKGEGTDITSTGTVRLTGDRELDIRADGRINLKLLESFSPDLTASGMVTVAVKVSGTYSYPSLVGQVDVSNASIASNSLPNGLSEMNGVLQFNQDRLQIQKLTAHIGGGTVELSGYMGYTPRLVFNISAQGTDVRLRPAGISATANADLKLTGSSNDATLSGDVTVVKLALTPGFDFARYLEASKQTTTLPQANSLLSKVRLDVHVTTTPELQMQSTLAKLSGDADLHLRGTIVRPVVLGRIDIMEGNIYFSGTKYRLERGEITFTGPVGIKPTLDLEAATHVRDYDITLGVNGTPEKLSFTYRSEPPLPEPDIIALLALGRTQSESATLAGGSSQSAFSQEASNVILNQALNATLNNRAQRLFGISRIKIDPQGLNTETSPTRTAPAVTIEQQVSSNLTLTYTTEVSQTSQQIIQGEYNLTRNVSILAVRDQNGVVSFDVRLRQRKK